MQPKKTLIFVLTGAAVLSVIALIGALRSGIIISTQTLSEFVQGLPLFGEFGLGATDYSFVIIDDYILFRSSAVMRSIDRPRVDGQDTVIDADIVELGWDDRYIVCTQDTRQDGSRSMIKWDKNSHQGTKWWMIDAREHRVYGPFLSEAELRVQERELGVVKSIELKPIDEYHPPVVQYEDRGRPKVSG